MSFRSCCSALICLRISLEEAAQTRLGRILNSKDRIMMAAMTPARMETRRLRFFIECSFVLGVLG